MVVRLLKGKLAQIEREDALAATTSSQRLKWLNLCPRATLYDIVDTLSVKMMCWVTPESNGLNWPWREGLLRCTDSKPHNLIFLIFFFNVCHHLGTDSNCQGIPFSLVSPRHSSLCTLMLSRNSPKLLQELLCLLLESFIRGFSFALLFLGYSRRGKWGKEGATSSESHCVAKEKYQKLCGCWWLGGLSAEQ